RRRWVIGAAVIVVPAVAVAMSLQQSSLYRASAAVLVNPQSGLASQIEGFPQTQDDPVRFLQTQVELARVPDVARQTLTAAGLKRWDPLQFLQKSSVSAEQDSDLLTFAVTDGNPALATQLATEYARQ